MKTNLLIIGAGPFGLSLAAYAEHHDIDYILVGKPMGFWKSNMPVDMYLRSACDWHLDPMNIHTIEAYLDTLNLKPADVEPLSRTFYLDYCRWFQEQKQIEADPTYIQRLHYDEDSTYPFRAFLEDGRTLTARHVALALGFKPFKHIPKEATELFPEGRYEHTCDLVDFAALRDKRCLIVGGRQSALEWTALVHEAGAAEIHLVHRHRTPRFVEADWSWVNPLVDRMVDDPGWYRNLPESDKKAITHRLWAEGRLKVEPWLEERVTHSSVHIWPNDSVVNCDEQPDGSLRIMLDSGAMFEVDQVILATGYKVRLNRIGLLADGNILPRLTQKNGYPVLDEHFQTNIPGLFITSMPAVQDFGPFFAFTISVRTSAHLIGRAVLAD